MVTEEAHGRDGVSPPVRPVADNTRGGGVTVRFHTGSRKQQQAGRNLLVVAVLLDQLAVVLALHLLPGLSQLLTHHTHARTQTNSG